MTGDRWDDLRGLDGSESWFPEMDGATILDLLAERDALAAALRRVVAMIEHEGADPLDVADEATRLLTAALRESGDPR